jgi:hypothetical protein
MRVKSRYDVLQDEHQRRRLALLLASPTTALAALLLAGAFLPGCSEAPAQHAAARPEALPAAGTKAPASKSPDHIVASEGDVDYREPLKYMGQPAVQ